MVLNVTRKTILAANALPAYSYFMRLRGMIGRSFSGFDGMYFPHCTSIHTFFMSQSLDVVFASRDGRVLDTASVRPWTACCRCGDAYGVLELPEGALMRSGTEPGDILDLNAELTEDVRRSWKEFYNGKTAASAALPAAGDNQ